MKLLFIRHGDPDYAHDTLTEKGWREAQALAAYLKDVPIDYFYCSPLGRAKDTASLTLAARGQEAEIRSFLHEFDAPMPDPVTGNLRIPWDFLPAEWAGDVWNLDASQWRDSSLYGGTAVGDVYDQVCTELDTLLASHGYTRNGLLYRVVKPNHDTIAFVCHMGITCVLLSHLLNISPAIMLHAAFVAPTSMTMLETEERAEGIAHFRLRFLGATPHLSAAGEPVSASGMFKEVYADASERLDMFGSF